MPTSSINLIVACQLTNKLWRRRLSRTAIFGARSGGDTSNELKNLFELAVLRLETAYSATVPSPLRLPSDTQIQEHG